MYSKKYEVRKSMRKERKSPLPVRAASNKNAVRKTAPSLSLSPHFSQLLFPGLGTASAPMTGPNKEGYWLAKIPFQKGRSVHELVDQGGWESVKVAW